MDPLEILKKEHEAVERELIELETIMDEEVVNYPNLIHVFRKLHVIWNAHEIREEKLFEILEKRGFPFPFKKMLFEHKELNLPRSEIVRAIQSGSEFETKKALDFHGRKLLKKLRKHHSVEEDIIYALPIEFSNEELKELESFFD